MKQYNHTLVSLLLLAVITTGCNNQPQNAPGDIATPVSVKELKKRFYQQTDQHDRDGTANLWCRS